MGGASSKCSWWCCCCRSCRRRRLRHRRRTADAAASEVGDGQPQPHLQHRTAVPLDQRPQPLSAQPLGAGLVASSTIAAPDQVEEQQPLTPSSTGCHLLSLSTTEVATSADRKTPPATTAPSAAKQQQLHDIEEEEDDDQPTLADDDGPLSGSSCSLTVVRKTANSPSPTFSSGVLSAAHAPWSKAVIAAVVTATAGPVSSFADRKRKNNLRTKSVTSTTSSDTCSSSGASTTQVAAAAAAAAVVAKMQAEQGSIGDLQKYHKFLRNRRHTLANVR